jgi:salicylate hydroxylase
MSDEAERRYGAPQLTMHRADLIEALEAALPAGVVETGRRVAAITETTDGALLRLADGTERAVSLVIGADGIHSVVRHHLFGEDHPRFTGVVAYRTIVPRAGLALPNLDAFTKWWGPDPETQLVSFPLSRGEDVFVFATTAQDSWLHESWTTPGSVEELRETYGEFHPEARALLAACEQVLKTALYERDPLPRWSRGRMTLLGDACHPMMPFMAQGAGMAIEDAVVLARCLAAADAGTPEAALRRYEAMRRDRTARVQIGSRGNEWLREGGNADWVYAYDAWGAPFPRADAQPG